MLSNDYNDSSADNLQACGFVLARQWIYVFVKCLRINCRSTAGFLLNLMRAYVNLADQTSYLQLIADPQYRPATDIR